MRRTPSRSSHRSPAGVRRPGLYLAVAAAGAVAVHVLTGAQPAAEAVSEEPISVATQLGLSNTASTLDSAGDLRPLEELVASRNAREDQQVAAQQAQAAADQAELDRRAAEAQATQAAEAEAAAAAAQAQAAAAAAAAVQAAAPADDDSPAAVSSGTVATAVAHISNSTGSVRPQTQAAANAVVSNVPGADEITLGGTRASATDPGGHPSGLALDYMVLSDEALGEAIIAYHRAHWDELGVAYLIYQQRMLSSPNGSWKPMEDRGSATANHMDHVHVNYR